MNIYINSESTVKGSCKYSTLNQLLGVVVTLRLTNEALPYWA